MTDLILTGLPRSGSAAVCALIDTLPDAVCLNAPSWQAPFVRSPVDILPFCKWLVGDYAWARRQLLNGSPLSDIRAADGSPLLDGRRDPGMVRDAEGQPQAVRFIRHGLREDFTLAMRQTTLFSSALPQIAAFRHFRILAVIRHPVAVGLSWHGLPQPLLSPGHPPGIARFWPEALEALAGGSLARQFAALYELHLQRYHETDGVTVLRYEDVMADPGLISRLLGRECLPAAVTRLAPAQQRQDQPLAEALRAVFRSTGVFSKLYYPDLRG
jgi:hypothetical protein